MIITHKITMDLGRFTEAPCIDAVQEDRYTRNVELSLYDQGSVWPVPAGAKVAIAYEKPDHTAGQYDSLPDGTTAWTAADHVLTLALAPQVLTAAGTVRLTVQIILEQQMISTFRFLIHVRPNVAVGLFESEDYINLQQWCMPILGEKLDRAGWTPNQYLGTDAGGNVIVRPGSDLLPAVTEADDGKFLRARGGLWTAESLTYAEGDEF